MTTEAEIDYDSIGTFDEDLEGNVIKTIDNDKLLDILDSLDLDDLLDSDVEIISLMHKSYTTARALYKSFDKLPFDKKIIHQFLLDMRIAINDFEKYGQPNSGRVAFRDGKNNINFIFFTISITPGRPLYEYDYVKIKPYRKEKKVEKVEVTEQVNIDENIFH